MNESILAAGDQDPETRNELKQRYEQKILREQAAAAEHLLSLCRIIAWGSGIPVDRAVICLLDAAQPTDLPRDSYDDLVRAGLSAVKKDQIMARDGYVCLRCGSELWLQVDHIVPVHHGGTNAPWNLQTLCRACNRAKGTGA